MNFVLNITVCIKSSEQKFCILTFILKTNAIKFGHSQNVPKSNKNECEHALNRLPYSDVWLKLSLIICPHISQV